MKPVKSKEFFLLILFTLLFLTPTCFSFGQSVSDIALPDKKVKVWLDDISNRIGILKDELMGDLDLITRERIEQLEILLKNLSISLEGKLDDKLSDLDGDIQKYIYGIQDYVDNKFVGIGDLPKDFDLILNSNLTDFCENLPNFLCPDEKINYSIRYIKGKFLTYSQAKTEYIIDFGGNIINEEADITLQVLGETFTSTPFSGFSNTSSENTMRFGITTSIFKPFFEDTNYKNIPATLTIRRKIEKEKKIFAVFKKKETTFDTLDVSFQFYLLPKYPIYYETIVKGKRKEWKSSPNFIREKTLQMRRNQLDNFVSFEFTQNERYKSLESYIIDNRAEPNKPWYAPSGEDTYFCVCDPRPRFQENRKVVTFNCRGGRVSTQFAIDIIDPWEGTIIKKLKNDLNDNLDKIFSNPPGYPIQTQFTTEKVHFKIQYDKKVSVPFESSISVESSSHIGERGSRNNYLSYGTHIFEPLDDGFEEYTIYVYSSLFGDKAERIILTPSSRTGKLDRLFQVEIREENTRNSSTRLRLKVSPTQN